VGGVWVYTEDKPGTLHSSNRSGELSPRCISSNTVATRVRSCVCGVCGWAQADASGTPGRRPQSRTCTPATSP
jgi:hypothetical protein